MSKFQNTLAVSSSANRAASARLQSENTRATAIRSTQKMGESTVDTIDEEPKEDTPLSPAEKESSVSGLIPEASTDRIA